MIADGVLNSRLKLDVLTYVMFVAPNCFVMELIEVVSPWTSETVSEFLVRLHLLPRQGMLCFCTSACQVRGDPGRERMADPAQDAQSARHERRDPGRKARNASRASWTTWYVAPAPAVFAAATPVLQDFDVNLVVELVLAFRGAARSAGNAERKTRIGRDEDQFSGESVAEIDI